MTRKLVLALIVANVTLQLTNSPRSADAGTFGNGVSSAPVTNGVSVNPLPLENGDFETGPFDTIGTVTGWSVVGNVADRSAEGSTSPTHSAVLSVGADSEGDMLSQQFTTTASQVYMLDFDAGVFGVPDTGANL